MNRLQNRRILLIDDTPSIHEDFRKILLLDTRTEAKLDAVEAALFGEEIKAGTAPFELDSAYRGQKGLAMVCESIAHNRPYAMAFVDMRMPLGWDGVETIERLWQEDSCLQIVICTAYSDYSWEEVLDRLDTRERSTASGNRRTQTAAKPTAASRETGLHSSASKITVTSLGWCPTTDSRNRCRHRKAVLTATPISLAVCRMVKPFFRHSPCWKNCSFE